MKKALTERKIKKTTSLYYKCYYRLCGAFMYYSLQINQLKTKIEIKFHTQIKLGHTSQESQRILPIAFGTARKTQTDLILSGYHVPKGSLVVRIGKDSYWKRLKSWSCFFKFCKWLQCSWFFYVLRNYKSYTNESKNWSLLFSYFLFNKLNKFDMSKPETIKV